MQMMPLCFGSLVVGFPVLQAALSGYSDLPMRTIARKFGAELTISEVLLDQFVVAVSNRKAKLYFIGEDEHPCGAQIMGNEPKLMKLATIRLIESGFDLIDLNFACPVKKVLARGRGGHLLKEPDTATKIIKEIISETNNRVPLTVKLRKGYDDSPKSKENFLTILNNAIELGVCGFTIHGRTVKEKYEGQSDWNFIREIKEYLVNKGLQNIAIVGSGDLFDAPTALRRLAETNINGLALARGAIGNPWLFRDIKSLLTKNILPKPPTLPEQKTILQEHYNLATKLYGESRTPSTMRAFAVYYSKLHPQSEQVRTDFVKVKNTKDWENVLEKWY
jgi:nifR3 family TIM-barrel protein